MVDFRTEFGREDEKTAKAAELRRLEQRGRTMEEFVQEFKRAAKRSRYEEQFLIEKFKRGINRTIY